MRHHSATVTYWPLGLRVMDTRVAIEGRMGHVVEVDHPQSHRMTLDSNGQLLIKTIELEPVISIKWQG